MGRLLVAGAITEQKDFEMGGSRLLRSGLVQNRLCAAAHNRLVVIKIEFRSSRRSLHKTGRGNEKTTDAPAKMADDPSIIRAGFLPRRLERRQNGPRCDHARSWRGLGSLIYNAF